MTCSTKTLSIEETVKCSVLAAKTYLVGSQQWFWFGALRHHPTRQVQPPLLPLVASASSQQTSWHKSGWKLDCIFRKNATYAFSTTPISSPPSLQASASPASENNTSCTVWPRARPVPTYCRCRDAGSSPHTPANRGSRKSLRQNIYTLQLHQSHLSYASFLELLTWQTYLLPIQAATSARQAKEDKVEDPSLHTNARHLHTSSHLNPGAFPLTC